MSVIETPRLSLREISTADDAFIFALMNEPAYLEHIGDRGVRTLESARSYIRDKFAASYTKFGYGLYLVELKKRREPIGICGLIKREALEDVDLGFAFLTRFWGNGYAHEAATAVMSYGA